MGPPGRGHRRRLHPPLRGAGRQEEARPGLEGRGQGRLGTDSGHRPRPRGRVDQLAPGATAQAQGAGAPHPLSRNHRGSHSRSARPRSRRRQPEPRPGAGKPSHPRPALRLHSLARPLEEGADRAQRRAGAERRRAADRGAGRRAARVPQSELLGHRSHAEERGRRRVPGHAHQGGTEAHRHGQGLQRPRRAAVHGGHAPRPGARRSPQRGPQAPHAVDRHERGREADRAAPVGAVHHLDPAAGSQPQARLLLRPHDERGPAPLPRCGSRRR